MNIVPFYNLPANIHVRCNVIYFMLHDHLEEIGVSEIYSVIMSYVLIHLRTRIVPWLDVLLLLRIRFGFRLETCERKK